MLIKKVTDYFDAFSKGDIVRIRSLLSDDVCLRDWNLDVRGIDLVLQEVLNIFSSLSHLQIKVANLYEINSTIIAEIIIEAKEISSIKVVDIITFDSNESICSIRAYKG